MRWGEGVGEEEGEGEDGEVGEPEAARMRLERRFPARTATLDGDISESVDRLLDDVVGLGLLTALTAFLLHVVIRLLRSFGEAA